MFSSFILKSSYFKREYDVEYLSLSMYREGGREELIQWKRLLGEGGGGGFIGDDLLARFQIHR